MMTMVGNSNRNKHDGEWTISLDEYVFNMGKFYKTEEEAIEEGKKYFDWLNEGECFYVGKVFNLDIGLGVNVDSVLDDMSNSVYDQVGEVAEDYLRYVSKEDIDDLEGKLNELVRNWTIEKGYEPNYFKVKEVRKITI